MEEIDWRKVRINLAGLAMQGMIEREQSFLSKLVSDTMYKKLAHHCVAIADEVVNELKNTDTNKK